MSSMHPELGLLPMLALILGACGSETPTDPGGGIGTCADVSLSAGQSTIVVASAAGLLVSFHYDLPTGPIVVCMFGLLLLVAFAARRLMGVTVPEVEPRVEKAA
jgi:hypothetical protein